MAKSDEDSSDPNAQSKQPFVSREDRPDVKITLDTPLSELRVRELSAILGFVTGKNPNFEAGKTSLKDFFDKPFPEVAKDWLKEVKSDKFEKNEKTEKPEKSEIKEVKNEKLETDGVSGFGRTIGPDPRIEQIIQAVAGLTRQVGQLANQVEELKKKIPG